MTARREPAGILRHAEQLSERLLHRLSGRLPASLGLRLLYLRRHGRLPRLNPPRTFTEKVLHRRLTDRNPDLLILADKLRVKPLIADQLGADWVTPTLWSGAQLPLRSNRDWPLPFVLKANWGSGKNIFVRTERERDWDAIERIVAQWISAPYPAGVHHWHAGSIGRSLLVEPYVGSPGALPLDYKFYVFGGKARFIQVNTARDTGIRTTVYDPNWTKQPFEMSCLSEAGDLERPASLDRMIAAAELLAAEWDFLRVDFYEVGGRPIFGEISPTPLGGMAAFQPRCWDRLFGDLWPEGR